MPVLYLVVIGALLYLQYGGRQTRRESVGDVEVSATISRSLLGRDRLRGLEVNYGPLKLRFSSGSAATLDDRSGITERLPPVEYRITASSVAVTLGSKVELTIEAGDGRLAVRASPLGSLPSLVALSLPIALDARAPAATLKGLPLLWISQTGCTTFVAAPDDGQLDERRVRAPLVEGSATTVLTVERCAAADDAYSYWFSRVTAPPTTESVNRLTEEYLRRCYASWQTQLAAGSVDVISQELLVTAYLTESLARGTLAQAVAMLQPRAALALNQGVRPARALPAVFVGMPQAYLQAARSNLTSVIGDISRRTASSDTSVFAVPHLLTTALDHGTQPLVEQLLTLAATVSPGSGDPNTLLDIARFYADVETSLAQTDGARGRLDQIVTEGIIPVLRRTEAGVFFLPSAASGESLDRTLVAGRLLVDVATMLDRGSLALVGRQCIESVLALAGSDGSLPARIRLDGARLVSATDALPPENVYELVVDGRYLPVQRSLRDEVGTGAWMLSAARIDGLSYQRGTLRASLAFPTGQPHYVVIQGMPSVAQVQLHGTAWRPDPDYYRYTDGWWYAADTRTLFIKLTGQRDVEELSVTFP